MSPNRRFGIGEWYGHSYIDLYQEKRHRFAAGDSTRNCPFRIGGGACTKKGGVCSFRLYEDAKGEITEVQGPEDGLRVLCPRRFEEDMAIFKWVGETVLGTPEPEVATEIGFLRAPDSASHVGRIDMVLTNGESDTPAFNWCALEIQAVYFSGRSMAEEFRNILTHQGTRPPFPSHTRRPDYRSSGPKRLMPQLQIKVPTLRRWGKKMAVVVDKHFYNSLGHMETVNDLSSGDIAWFTVDFKQTSPNGPFKLTPDTVHVTTLERATEGLTGGTPVTITEFEQAIRSKLQS